MSRPKEFTSVPGPKLGKTFVTIGDYERQKAIPPLPVLLAYCDIFDLDLHSLVHRDLAREGAATPAEDPYQRIDELTSRVDELQRFNRLLEQRVQDLEREIRARAPGVARELGL